MVDEHLGRNVGGFTFVSLGMFLVMIKGTGTGTGENYVYQFQKPPFPWGLYLHDTFLHYLFILQMVVLTKMKCLSLSPEPV